MACWGFKGITVFSIFFVYTLVAEDGKVYVGAALFVIDFLLDLEVGCSLGEETWSAYWLVNLAILSFLAFSASAC